MTTVRRRSAQSAAAKRGAKSTEKGGKDDHVEQPRPRARAISRAPAIQTARADQRAREAPRGGAAFAPRRPRHVATSVDASPTRHRTTRASAPFSEPPARVASRSSRPSPPLPPAPQRLSARNAAASRNGRAAARCAAPCPVLGNASGRGASDAVSDGAATRASAHSESAVRARGEGRGERPIWAAPRRA